MGCNGLAGRLPALAGERGMCEALGAAEWLLVHAWVSVWITAVISLPHGPAAAGDAASNPTPSPIDAAMIFMIDLRSRGRDHSLPDSGLRNRARAGFVVGAGTPIRTKNNACRTNGALDLGPMRGAAAA
jgi:hypothetical protein